MKRLAAYTLVVMATLAGLALLWFFRSIVGLFALSLLAAAAVRPLLVRLVKRGLPQYGAIILIYLIALVVLVAALAIVGGPLLNEAQTVVNDLAFAYERLRSAWVDGTEFQEAVASRLPPPDDLYAETITGREGQLLARTLFCVTQGLLTALGGVGLVLVLSVYWTISRERFERLWLSLVPAGQRADARKIWRDIEYGVGAYIRSETVQGFIAALLLGLGFWLIGIDYPLLLALAGAIAWLIPLIGTIFAVVPVLLVGLATGPLVGVGAALYTLVVLLVLELVVEPRFFDRRRYSSLAILLTMVPLADAFGIVGIIVAPALAAAIQILLVYLFSRRGAPAGADLRSRLDDLKARVSELEAVLDAGEGPPPPEVDNLFARLSDLMEEADDALTHAPQA